MDTKIIRQLASVPPPARKWKYTTARSAHARINELEQSLGLSVSAMGFNLTVSNERIGELEALLASMHAAPAANSISVALTKESAPALADGLRGTHRVIAPAPGSNGAAPTEEAVPGRAAGLKGRDRFVSAVARDAGKKPKLASHPDLHGRERFAADVRINATTTQISSENQKPIRSDLSGRARFSAAVKSRLAKKQENNQS